MFFASCKIKTHIHFNKDHSGNVTISYDLTELLASAELSDSSNLQDSMIYELQKFDTLKFLKKYKINKTEQGLDITYSFDNIDDLNTSLNQFMKGDDMMERATGKFSEKRKKICYTIPESTKDEDKKEDYSDDEMIPDDIFEWEFKVSFEQKIVSCSNKKYSHDKNDNSINIKGSLRKFQNADEMNFTVKLKN